MSARLRRAVCSLARSCPRDRVGQQMREQATPVGSWRVDTAGRLCEGDSIIEDLDRDFNDIRVRSFILTGAPKNSGISRTDMSLGNAQETAKRHCMPVGHLNVMRTS